MNESLLPTLHIPTLKTYRYFKIFNPQNNKWSMLFVCDYEKEEGACGMKFKKWHNLFDHLRSHVKEKPFFCNYENCQARYSQKSNLNKHVLTHSTKKRYPCRNCQQEFSSKLKLKLHYREMPCQLESEQ
mmetsp:Transcript_1416/g.917  ORF Transcript_1416/g.917 Transcript_1416/m.917 type:complete len:129 (-) Transcript_1416:103-489(-)